MPTMPHALIAARRAKPLLPLWDRFWANVDMRAGLTGCWMWRGALSTNHKRKKGARGTIQEAGRGSRLLKAHRLALCFAGEGLEEYGRPEVAAHRCGNPLCCNSYSHLYWATPGENVEDRFYHERRPVCFVRYEKYKGTWGDPSNPRHSFLAELERIGR